MEYELDYSEEKFTAAVDLMAVSEGSLADRLELAYRHALVLVFTGATSIRQLASGELNERIEALRERIERDDEEPPQFHALGSDELAEIAREIVDVLAAIRGEIGAD